MVIFTNKWKSLINLSLGVTLGSIFFVGKTLRTEAFTIDFNYDYDIDIINKVIENHLSYHTILGDPFQFVWYKNPKPTIPEFYHVQVFWTSSINSANN